MLDFLLGLPYLREGVLWQTARRLKAPVLVSANALSRWRKDEVGLRVWTGFDRRILHLVTQHPVALDSGGFVASVLYRGSPFTVPQYMDLCAAAPWTWFASMDVTCEPEIAGDEETVQDRIAGTVRLNRECLREARERGIADRFVPVVQGYRVEHYLRCIDKMPDLSRFPLMGIGSMCRRHVEDDEVGILRIVEAGPGIPRHEMPLPLLRSQDHMDERASRAPARAVRRQPGMGDARQDRRPEGRDLQEQRLSRNRHGRLVSRSTPPPPSTQLHLSDAPGAIAIRNPTASVFGSGGAAHGSGG